MHAIDIRQPSRRFFRRSLATVLVSTLGVTTFSAICGCSQGRIFSPIASRRAIDDSAPSMHGPSIGGPAQMQANARAAASRNASQIRVTSENAVPETDIEPVEQRLAVSQQSAAVPVKQVSHQSAKSAVVAPPEQVAEALQNANSDRFANTPAAPPAASEGASASLSDAALNLPEGYDGVDVSELMSALQDAPPEIQKAAIARLIAMSRKRARPSDRPRAIEDALAASFDSLPELPDEVIDRGVNPTRIGSAAADAAPTVKTVSAVAPTNEDVSQSPVHTAAHESLSDQMPEAHPNAAQTPLAQNSSTQTPAEPLQTASLSGDQSAIGTDKGDVAANSSDPNAPNQESVAIAVMQTPVANAQPVAESTTASADMTDAELFDALVKRLQTNVPGESDADRHRRQVVARHLMVLSGDPDRAVDNLEGLSNEEQEYLRHQLLGLWTIIDPKGHPVPSRRFSSALPEIRKATGYLAAASDSLEVRSLEFCTEIESYGQIKPFPSRRFSPGQEVILYCEIENFVANSVDGGFETRLQGSYDLLDQNGHRVSSQTLPEDRQISKKHLRDYFIAYQMYLPDSIEPGNYQLRLTMEDVHGKKYGQSIVDFQIKR
ncbi:hypothetical protein FHS27_003619 [Rhodopirellula rubra]|uniref:Uncharacterized protein n=1 Tax=Aporhodopirellula rubra TaxID=980271 RepID=A0A7W5E0W9_9BACT|nr:hypothetical protein [Aporhodopirellula rubra]MBB3207792.1 hypothetical protein [Aporhodopirellula rubra]